MATKEQRRRRQRKVGAAKSYGRSIESIEHRVKEIKRAHQEATKEMRDRINREARANDTLQSILIAREDNRERMFESYEGVVQVVHEDRVTVIYEVGDELVEQTYTKEQFTDGQLPAVGDRLAVYVHVAELPREEEPTADVATKDAGHEQPRRRKNVAPLPRTF